MVNDGIRCAVCRTMSFEETALHSIDCPRHDPETCETCCTTHEESAALRARLALVERYVVKLEGLMGRPMSEPSVPRQVLIVEDHARVRDLLRDVFVTAGYQCRLAANGREGLDAFQQERPSLTLTDIKMPVMDGLDFLKRARAIDGDAAIIVLTAFTDVKTAIESLKCGAYDYIVKPVDVEEVLIRAERALERRQLLMERREFEAFERYFRWAD